MTKSAAKISPDEENKLRESFNDNGYVLIRGIVPAKLLEELRQEADRGLGIARKVREVRTSPAAHPEIRNQSVALHRVRPTSRSQ